MEMNTLRDLYIEQLRDLYDAENQLVKALPKMAKGANSDELRQGFEEHLEQTRQHVQRLETIFEQLGEKPKGEKCKGMEGLVKEGSVSRGDGLAVRFEVTDGKSTVRVAYQGLLPDLFREGQGIVAEGSLDGSGVFRADNVLAKHDETYMPKDVADALKKQGHWKDDYGAKPSQGAAKPSQETAK
jgi:cytochrome c-type biogenesis protein CcmE